MSRCIRRGLGLATAATSATFFPMVVVAGAPIPLSRVSPADSLAAWISSI